MAGILKRFKDIMASNINALIDKAEDPAKMIDQYLRNLEEDLGKVKAETAAIMAEETRCKRQLDECNAEVAKMQSYAEKAVKAGNDNDARQFLTKKQQLETKLTGLQQAYTVAAGNATKMRSMHDKLVGDIGELNARRDAIKAKVQVAKTQERLNEIGASFNKSQASLSAFARMEAKADKMLDKANAMAELNMGDGFDDLEDKYASDSSVSGVDDELAALKAQMGLGAQQ